MTEQEKLDKELEAISDEYQRQNKEQQESAVSEFAFIIAAVALLLSDNESKDGTIKRQSLNKIIRALEPIEKQLRTKGEKVLADIIEDTAKTTTKAVTGALKDVGGAAATRGIVVDEIVTDVKKAVLNRLGDDGLKLSDRVWNLAGDTRNDIAKALRTGILQGESVGQLTKRVREVHENETWKIRRLVVTEGNTAFRTAVAYSAQQSEIVTALQVHRGKADRPEHRCSQLERADSYGLGRGLYPPTASEIYNPHPNCTGFLTYVLDERWL